MAWLHCTTLAAFLGIAAAWDMRHRRIPNAVAGGFTAAALALAAVSGGTTAALTGLVLAFGLLVGPFAGGYLGAGDVKFFAGVGAFLGPRLTLCAFLLASVWGALVVAAAHRERLAAVVSHVDARGIPYAVPLALGTASALLLEWMGHPLL